MSSSRMTVDLPGRSRMRLAEFIIAHMEPILAQWEAFARTIWPESGGGITELDPADLRDHAEAILRAVVVDMGAEQSVMERAGKSMGHRPDSPHSRRLDTASHQHGAERVTSGFKLLEVLAEYRALRASVFKLWRESHPNPHATDLDDLTRFHESIDQSLAQAVESFTDRVDQSRRLFLAILGHDLRNPLNAMTMSAQMLVGREAPDPEIVESASQIATSAAAMGSMIGDLLDFTASGLGGGMPLSPTPADLHVICRAVIDEIHAGNPDCLVDYMHEGSLNGEWDQSRMRQVISNLLGNAVQHGGNECRVTLSVRDRGEEVEVLVHNSGTPIPPTAISTIFDPLRRLAASELPRRHRPGSIGLGLYIAHQVVTSHGGTIAVISTTDAGTTFTVRLPRHPQPKDRLRC